MRAIANRAVGLAIVATVFGLTECHSSQVARAPAPAATGPAPGEPVRASHLRLAALVPKAPVTLTSSDGKGLMLTHLSARAVLEGPLAFTELHMVFANPEPRVLEGTFAIALPQGASISRFAMRIGDRWQEGEVVEKQRAREAYEDFLHRKRDPALLEQSAGNEFQARVFPIPPSGAKDIVVSFAQELRGAGPYVLPLRGLPAIDVVDLSATGEGANLSLATRHEERWAPDQDFVVDRTPLPHADGLRSGNLALAVVRPAVESRPDPLGSALVLVDTSASRALDLDAQMAALAAVLAKVAAQSPRATVTVACFDQEVVPVYAGPAGGFGAKEVEKIRARSALGASDLGVALAWARDHAREVGARRVLLLSDGVATAGSVEGPELVASARALGPAGIERIDALAMGGIRDDAVLGSIARAGLVHDGVVVDATGDAQDIARRLGSATRSGVKVEVAGATWWHPRTVDGAQPGDEVLVYAEVGAAAPVSITVGGAASVTPHLRPVERPLLERAWAQAKIASLAGPEGADGNREATRKQVVDLSTSHRVLSPYTALLVLETERDYARFHIDHSALADILEVQGSRVALTHRADAVVSPGGPFKATPLEPAAQSGMIGLLSRDGASAAAWRRDDAPSSGATGSLFGGAGGDSFGAGGLGLAGVGEGGGGSGEGIGRGIIGHGAYHAARAAGMPAGATTVVGRVPPEVIQRIVRHNFGRIRACHENALRAHPALRGRVAIRFVIDRAGSVTTAGDGGSDVNDPALVRCIAGAFRLLAFPRPEGGEVTVVYPIVFGADGAVPPTVSVAADAPPPASPAPAPVVPADVPGEGEPYAGRFADVMRKLAGHDAGHALDLAWAWHDESPGDVLALVALGEALEASGDEATAARAYGSIIDLYPSSADMRRMAGERLERLEGGRAMELAADSYARTVADRPDHPSSHRMLAYALLKKRDYAGAFDAALAGVAHRYPDGRYLGVDRILREDVGLIGAAWAAAEPARRDSIWGRVRSAGATVEDSPSLRFVLSWESDGNDVDLHVRDAEGNHAYYEHPSLQTGGALYADVTTGYGPECFGIRMPKEKRSPRYSLQVHYYARGPMGYGMGKVEIVEHDGKGGLKFDERPFVVMNDHAFVDLGDY